MRRTGIRNSMMTYKKIISEMPISSTNIMNQTKQYNTYLSTVGSTGRFPRQISRRLRACSDSHHSSTPLPESTEQGRTVELCRVENEEWSRLLCNCRERLFRKSQILKFLELIRFTMKLPPPSEKMVRVARLTRLFLFLLHRPLAV